MQQQPQYAAAPQAAAAPAPAMNQGPVMETPADADCALPWARGTRFASGCLIMANILLVLGIILKTVMLIDESLLGVDLEVKISYYGATSSVGDQSADYDLNDATCGKAGLLRFAGAVHYFCVIAVGLASFALLHELRQKKFKGHFVLIALIGAGGMHTLCNICLAMTRSAANYSTCNTVLPGLVRYGMGLCWLCLDAASGCVFWGSVAYVCSRYFKCCCYTRPVQAQTAYAQPMMVTGQPVQGQPIQQQPQASPYGQQQQQYAPQPQAASPYGQQQQAYPQQQGYPQQQQQGYPQQQPPQDQMYAQPTKTI